MRFEFTLSYFLFDVVAAEMGNYSSSSWSTEEVIRRLQPVASVEINQLSRSVNARWYEHDSHSKVSNISWSEHVKMECECNSEAAGLKTAKYERKPSLTAANGARSDDVDIEHNRPSGTSELVSMKMVDHWRGGNS